MRATTPHPDSATVQLSPVFHPITGHKIDEVRAQVYSALLFLLLTTWSMLCFGSHRVETVCGKVLVLRKYPLSPLVALFNQLILISPLFGFFGTDALHSPSCPGTHHVDQALRGPPAHSARIFILQEVASLIVLIKEPYNMKLLEYLPLGGEF